jgi:hypothetical protein
MPNCLHFRLLSEQGQVPADSGGLYLFRLRFPSNYELGFLPGTSPELSKVIATTANYLVKVQKALASTQLAGTLDDVNKANHLQTTYNLIATISSFEITSDVEMALNHCAERGSILELLNTIRIFFEFLPPLYIGMTSRQSLNERLCQHINETTKLHERLLACEISWTELTFTCLPIEEANMPRMITLEKIFQSLCKPQLSYA